MLRLAVLALLLQVSQWSYAAGQITTTVMLPTATPTPGGHLRAATLGWQRITGNTVEFTIWSQWRRSYEGNIKNGVSASEEIYIGDIITVGGVDSPRLMFGDGSFSYIHVQVTDVSAVDDWFAGYTNITHTYQLPNLGYRVDIDVYGDTHITQGQPWEAKFTGCCRLSGLEYASNEAWDIATFIDLQVSTGLPIMQSSPTLSFFRMPDTLLPASQCVLPGPIKGTPGYVTGLCTRVQWTTLPCGNHQSPVGSDTGFVVAQVAPIPQIPSGNYFTVEYDGTLRMQCIPTCPPAGVYPVGLQISTGHVTSVKFSSTGTNQACTGGTIILTDNANRHPNGTSFEATYTAKDGVVVGVQIVNTGSGYYKVPGLSIPQCQVVLEAVMSSTTSNVLVNVVEPHVCRNAIGVEVPCTATVGVQYYGIPVPRFKADEFPGAGYGWNAATKRLIPPVSSFVASQVDGSTGLQTAHGHAVAFAGVPFSATFTGSSNWCQDPDGTVPALSQGVAACLPDEDLVSFNFGPLPSTADLSSFTEDAIIDLMVTYDNPFSSHRPGHEHTRAKLARDFANSPTSEQAVQMGFTRIDQNLNSGNGGATVNLWYKKYNTSIPKVDQPAITHINISESPAQEEELRGMGFVMLEGNLNEQAGGAVTHLWYKKSSGLSIYDRKRPTADGYERGISEIQFAMSTTPSSQIPVDSGLDINIYRNATQKLPEWTKVEKNINAGLQNPINLYFKRGLANPFSQSVLWTPCNCDVGRHYICAAPRSSRRSSFDRVAGDMKCLAVDVVADTLPEYLHPAPSQEFELFMGRETRIPVTVMIHNWEKEVDIDGHDLPSGAALDVMTSPSEGCAYGRCHHRSRDLTWTPAWNQGGLSVTSCFSVSDDFTGCEPPGQAEENIVCIKMTVHKCSYAVQSTQHLQEIAALYSTDWLTVYSLNPEIKTPDRLMHDGQLVNIGHMYMIVPGDTLSKIAQRFGTTIDIIKSLNADILMDDQIVSGGRMCIIPNSCTLEAM